MRQALIEAMLMSEKRACDAVYVATLTEELCNFEKKIVALEEIRRSPIDENLTEVSAVPEPDDLPSADWIHRKTRELELRLRSVEQTSQQYPASTGATREKKAWRAVPRYPKTQGATSSRNA